MDAFPIKPAVIAALIAALAAQAAGEIDCSRDYGGKIIIGECWYKKGDNFYKVKDLSDFTWAGGYDGGFLFNVTETPDPFWVRIKPYFNLAGTWYDAQEIHNTYPNADLSHIIQTGDDYKFGANLSNLPPIVSNNLLSAAYTLDASEGINWDDVTLDTEGHRVFIKEFVIGYDDLLAEGYTLNLYDKTILLIGNVTGRTELFLDPTISLNSTSLIKDTYTDAGVPNSNFGSSTVIDFDSRNPDYGWVRINITDLQGYTIDNARLYWWHDAYDYNGGEDVLSMYEVFNHTWEENTITWNNQPCDFSDANQCNLTAIDSVIDTYTGHWINWNFTTPARNQLDNGYVDLVFKQSAGNLFIAYYSSTEWVTGPYRMYAIIDYSEGGGPGNDCSLTTDSEWIYAEGDECVIDTSYDRTVGDIIIGGDSIIIIDGAIVTMPSDSNAIQDGGGKLVYRNGGQLCGAGGCG